MNAIHSSVPAGPRAVVGVLEDHVRLALDRHVPRTQVLDRRAYVLDLEVDRRRRGALLEQQAGVAEGEEQQAGRVEPRRPAAGRAAARRTPLRGRGRRRAARSGRCGSCAERRPDRDRLPEDRALLLRGDLAEVAEIDLVMLAGHAGGLARDDLVVQPLEHARPRRRTSRRAGSARSAPRTATPGVRRPAGRPRSAWPARRPSRTRSWSIQSGTMSSNVQSHRDLSREVVKVPMS